MTRGRSAGWVTPELLATILILAAYILWIISMPLLPTEDGPVHLYYAQILAQLLTHSNATTAHFFRIKHLLPPYSLYYYVLILFSRFGSFLLADRLAVCLYFVLFIAGFRYFAGGIGRNADRATLFATLLPLNWALGMGFVNFDLALAISLWAAGLWVRCIGKPGVWRRVGFVVLAFTTMLTHPVPLLVLLAFCAITLGVEWYQHRRDERSRLPPFFQADVVALACASLTLGYIKLFTSSNALAQVDHPASRWSLFRENVYRFGSGYGVCFLTGHALVILAYRLGLMLILFGALAVAIRQMRRDRSERRWSLGDTCLVCSVLLFIAMPVLPSSINGSTHFADRLLIFVWLAALGAAAGSGVNRRGGSTRVAILAVALAINGCLLYAANRFIRPLADSIASLESLPVTQRGKIGLIVEDLRQPNDSSYANPTWEPYMWAPVHLFRHEQAVLANPPWLNLAIIPVGSRPALPASWIPQRLDDMPLYLARDLQRSGVDRERVLSAVSFVIVTQPSRSPGDSLEPMSSGDTVEDQRWPCATGAALWYRVCSREQSSAP
jgi:hypothetical protein